MIVEVGGDGAGCPRCDAPVSGRDPFCRYCGMALEGYHAAGHMAELNGTGKGSTSSFRPLKGLSRVLVAALAVDAVIAVALAIVLFTSVAAGNGAGGSVTVGGERVGWIWPLRLVCASAVTITAVLFLKWFTRAYSNLGALAVHGADRRPAMALFSWFIPLANLVLPKEMIDDLWRASDPSTPVNSIRWRLRSVPYRIHIWWIATLLASVSLVTVQWMLPGADGVPTSVGNLAVIVVVLAYPMLAVSAVLLAMLVSDISERQKRRVEVLSGVSSLRPRGAGSDGTEETGDDEEWVAGSALVHSAGLGVSGRY